MVAIGSVPDGDFTDMQRPLDPQAARLVQLPLASVDARAELTLSDLAEKPVDFSRDEIADGTVKTVESGGLVAGAAKSLAGDLDVQVNILGLGLGLGSGALKSLVGETVGAAAPVLDGLLEGSGKGDVVVKGGY